jgi:hypothetical protein
MKHKKIKRHFYSFALVLVELSGLEPLTSTLPEFINSLSLVIAKSQKACPVRVIGGTICGSPGVVCIVACSIDLDCFSLEA